jgi:glycosyltransferase involved in cell wall biosynthesis
MAGFTRWKFSSDMTLIDSLGIRERIHFTGYVQPDEIPALYNMASAFVFPSIYEGFGLPILEAMACGCPVITSTTGYAPEVAGDAAMLVNPYRPDEIGNAIQQVLNDAPLRSRLIEKGLQRVKEFSWRKTAQDTIALFESLGTEKQARYQKATQGQNAT